MNESELPLVDTPPDARELAQHTEALLAAYKASGVWRHGISFDRALRNPALRICITTAAEIKIKRQQEHTPCAA